MPVLHMPRWLCHAAQLQARIVGRIERAGRCAREAWCCRASSEDSWPPPPPFRPSLTVALAECRSTADAAAIERRLCRAGRDVDGRLVHAPQRTVGRDRSGEHSPNGVLPILLPLVLCAGSTGPEPRPGPHLRRWANQAFVLHGTPARHHCALGHSRVLTLVPSLCLLITSRPAVRLLARTTLEATLYSRASAR